MAMPIMVAYTICCGCAIITPDKRDLLTCIWVEYIHSEVLHNQRDTCNRRTSMSELTSEKRDMKYTEDVAISAPENSGMLTRRLPIAISVCVTKAYEKLRAPT